MAITLLYQEEREQLAEIVKKMFSRYETNTAGGNVSVRINDQHISEEELLAILQKQFRSEDE